MGNMPIRYKYVDNIRIVLTMLVVLHHWAIANGAPGDWYITENSLLPFQFSILGIFIATNQAFFMGFFFLISAYFVPLAYQKKGGYSFLINRFKRLGIPLLIYSFIISPLLQFVIQLSTSEKPISLSEFIHVKNNIFQPGPLWFVELLLAFNVLYYLYRRFWHKNYYTTKKIELRAKHIVYAIAFLSIGTYSIRIFTPVGYWLPYLQIQPAHLLQYIFCFCVGLATQKFKIDSGLNLLSSKRIFLLAQIFILILLPFIFITSQETDFNRFMGGKNILSLLYSFWEQATAILLMLAIAGIFKFKWNTQGSFAKKLSENCYTVYITHSIVLVGFSLTFSAYENASFAKFILLSPIVLVFCFLFAELISSLNFKSNVRTTR